MEINIDIKKIYRQLCPECKKKLEAMVEKNVAREATKQFLGEEEK